MHKSYKYFIVSVAVQWDMSAPYHSRVLLLWPQSCGVQFGSQSLEWELLQWPLCPQQILIALYGIIIISIIIQNEIHGTNNGLLNICS